MAYTADFSDFQWIYARAALVSGTKNPLPLRDWGFNSLLADQGLLFSLHTSYINILEVNYGALDLGEFGTAGGLRW